MISVSARLKDVKNYKKKITAARFCSFFGVIGVHRFYLGKTGAGILSLFTLGGSSHVAKVLMVCLAVAAIGSGCVSSSGSFKGQTTDTSVILSSANYGILKPGATGQDSGLKILGFPFKSPSYAIAKKNLYKKSKVEMKGKPAALANQTEDVSEINYLLFSIPTLTVTADVIEFEKESQ